jgi:hypothetical protein
MGNPVLARAFVPELRTKDAKIVPMWTASDALEAVRLSALKREHVVMHIHVKQEVEASAPEEFADFNEHERDAVYKAKAKAFMLAHPWVTLRLMIAKGRRYFLNWGVWGRFSTILAIIGSFLALQDPRARAVVLLALGFSAPYVLTQPIYYRYRYPIEPLFLLLAAFAVTVVASRLWNLRHGRDVATS